MPTATSIRFPVKGMHYSLDPVAVPEDAYQLGINVAIHRQTVAQRAAVRQIPIRSHDEKLAEEFAGLNLQGAIAYAPSRGQSALQFSSKADFIALSARGRKFLLEVVGRGASAYANLIEITGENPQAYDLHLSWLGQAENYLIAADDFGKTWTFDGGDTAELSAGYNPSEPEESRVPNRARLPVYTHGRLAMVTGARSVLVGDIIHGENGTNAADLLNFKEQVYWATGAEFTLPTNAGAILAAYDLPTTGSSNTHGDYILEAENRVYSIRTSIYPRTSWIDTPNMVSIISAEGGARGPYAFDVYDDNAIRRTLRGLETLSFTRAASDLVYDPQQLLSDPVDDFLHDDFGPLLRFNSTKIDRITKQVLTTTRPWVSGAHWKHRGVMSFNYRSKIWESVNVYPSSAQDVKVLVPQGMSGETRMFMLAGHDETGDHINLFEVEPSLRADIIDGKEYPIRSAIYTRAVFDNLRDQIEIEDGHLQFSRVEGDVNWEVLWKSDWSSGKWEPWHSGKICSEGMSSTCEVSSPSPGVAMIDLGKFNGKEVNGVARRTGLHFEFMIRWEGKADLRFHTFRAKRTKNENITNPVDDAVCHVDQIAIDRNTDPLSIYHGD